MENLLIPKLLPIVYEDINTHWSKMDSKLTWYSYSSFGTNHAQFTTSNKALKILLCFGGNVIAPPTLDEIKAIWPKT